MDYGFLNAPIYNHSSSFAVYIRVVAEGVGALGQTMSIYNLIAIVAGIIGLFVFIKHAIISDEKEADVLSGCDSGNPGA